MEVLEQVRWAVGRPTADRWFERRASTRELALLTTCHRVELYVLTDDPGERERWRETLPGPRDSWRVRERADVALHLFRVAAGRESAAPGESEVRRQVQAAGRTILSRHPRPVLGRLFADAVSTATLFGPTGGEALSIAALAAERLRELLPRPSPRVVVVGTGTVGRQVVRALAGFARPTLVFHERPPDEQFLADTGTAAVPLRSLSREIVGADAVVTAAKFGDRGLRPADLPAGQPIVLVDLGMPRNIDPAVRALPGVQLVDLKNLYDRTPPIVGPAETDRRVAARAEASYEQLEPLLQAPGADALLRRWEEARRDELAAAREFLGPMTADQEAAVDRLTRRLVTRLVVPSVERLRRFPPGSEGERRRREALELLAPSDAAP